MKCGVVWPLALHLFLIGDLFVTPHIQYLYPVYIRTYVYIYIYIYTPGFSKNLKRSMQ